jgi:hypothetical protein
MSCHHKPVGGFAFQVGDVPGKSSGHELMGDGGSLGRVSSE